MANNSKKFADGLKTICETESAQENEFNKIINKLKPCFGYPANTQFIESLHAEMEELLKTLNNNNTNIIEEINIMDVSRNMIRQVHI